jgi:hypothetical protein
MLIIFVTKRTRARIQDPRVNSSNRKEENVRLIKTVGVVFAALVLSVGPGLSLAHGG